MCWIGSAWSDALEAGTVRNVPNYPQRFGVAVHSRSQGSKWGSLRLTAGQVVRGEIVKNRISSGRI